MRLSENAFYLLGTSPYEQKYRIIDKCKDKLFEEDDDGVDYEAQQNILLSPVKRLHEEVRWFYSEDLDIFESIKHRVELFEHKAFQMQSPLARINLLIYSMMEGKVPRSLSDLVLSLDKAYNEIDCESILLEINEAREVAGISAVKDAKQMDKEIESLKGDIRQSLQYITKELPSSMYMREALYISKETYGRGHYNDIATEFLSVYHLDIQCKVSDLEELILEQLQHKDRILCKDLFKNIQMHFEEIFELEAPLVEYSSIHDVELGSRKIFTAFRNILIEKIDRDGIEAIYAVLQDLKGICASNTFCIRQLEIDTDEIEEIIGKPAVKVREQHRRSSEKVNTNSISTEQTAEEVSEDYLDKILDMDGLLVEYVKHEVNAGPNNLSVYHNYFIPYIDTVIQSMYKNPEFYKNKNDVEEVSEYIAGIYQYMARGLLYAGAFGLSLACLESACYYVKKSNNPERINEIYTEYERIKDFYEREVESHSQKKLKLDESMINSLISDKSKKEDSSKTEDFLGCLFIIVILFIGWAIAGFKGVIISIIVMVIFGVLGLFLEKQEK